MEICRNTQQRVQRGLKNNRKRERNRNTTNKESEKGHTQESGTTAWHGRAQETVEGRGPGAVDIADGTNQTNESVYLPSKMCLPYAYAIMLYIPILPLP